MAQSTRSRQAQVSAAPQPRRPLYARALGLRHLRPSGLWCFLFFEGAIALGVLLALAELVEWWAVLVLPAVIAVMVKLNDVVAGALVTTGQRTRRHRRANHRRRYR